MATPVETQLAELAERFVAAQGRRPTKADIEACPSWSALYHGKKEAERAEAEALRVPGGCSVYIVRRRRYCTHAAADGLGGLCSEHAAASAPAPPAALPSRVDESARGRKRNLGRRMKRMSNPLAVRCCAALPEWPSLFSEPERDTLLDIGCAKGRFLHSLAASGAAAEALGPLNFLGIELFGPLVVAANAARDAAGLRNLHFVAGNANASLPLLTALPRLRHVLIQFPDPWQEDEASKRLVTPPLVRALAAATAEGARVYLVSDRLDLATDMRSSFLAECGHDDDAPLFALHPLHDGEAASAEGWCPAGRRTRKEGQPAAAAAGEGAEAQQPPPPPPGGWLRMRPYLLPTERDKWRPVYRTLLARTAII